MPLTVDQFDRIAQTGQVFDPFGNIQKPRGVAHRLPRITIVTPSFNQADYLEECLDSVLSQGYPDLEYIVMDGGSTDGSVEIIRKYAKYLSYWQSQPDGGQYPAINQGFRRSSGEVMAWLNSDDRYWPGALKAVGEAFGGNSGLRWLTGRPSVIDGKGTILDIQRLPSLTYADYLDRERDIFLQQESTFWRRSLWEEAGGALDESLSLAADFELWLRFFRSDQLCSTDRLLGAFRWHEGQKSGVFLDRYLSEVRATIDKEKTSRTFVAPPAPAAVPIELITSLIPRPDRFQRMAVKSWLRLGFQVTSINVAAEQEILKPMYPELRFVAPRRDGRSRVGKPMIYFDDILECCAKSTAAMFGIINSDIHLAADAPLLETIVQEARGSLVYGSRFEVDSPLSARGWLYTSGFDFFFFDRTLLDVYPKSDFMLGVPWWDYWAPLIPALKGFPLKNLRAPMAFHVSHPANYDFNQLRDFGVLLAEKVGKHRITEMHERHNRLANDGALPSSRKLSVTVLADMVRQHIARAAQRIDWSGPLSNLNDCVSIGRGPGEYRVTAIVSTYDSEAFIAECLNDIFGQTIAEAVEVIVIDACSPGDEGRIVSEFQRSRPGLRYVRTAERVGVYTAWNMAARMAKGRYLVSCSTNDRLRRDAFELMADMLDEQPEVALVYGNSYLTKTPHQSFDEFEDLTGLYDWPEFSFANLLSTPGIGPHPMWRRRLHDQYGYFDERYRAVADQDFWLRIGRRESCLHLHDFTGLYWSTEDSLSGRMALAQSEYREINEAHRREFSYESWRSTRYFTTAIGRRYEERMEVWPRRPSFTVCIRHTQTGFEALARTIGALAAQYYEDVSLLVISAAAPPSELTGKRFEWAVEPSGDWTRAVAKVSPCGDAHWLLVISDGDTVDPMAFLRIGELLASHPHWKVVYTDEDELHGDGSHAAPHFKPPPNPEWLLAAPYAGESMLVSVDWLTEVGGLDGRYPGAEMYDLLLRTLDRSGVSAVGHVPDVLLHRPAGRWSCYPTQAHVDAVEAAGERRQMPSTLCHGLGGTLRVRPELHTAPSVAVLIPYLGKSGAFDHTITSLLEKTAYPSMRLLVLDLSSPDAEGRDFVSGLAAMGLPNLAVVAGNGRSLDCLLADVLPGLVEELLVLWHEGNIAAQAEWLQELVREMQRPDIEAVGPRLANGDLQIVSAGLELGVMGAADSPYKGVGLDYPGDSAALMVVRRVLSLDPRCILIRKAALLSAAQSEIDPSSRIGLTELALGFSSGKSCLWTPYSTVMVLENLRRLEQDDQQKGEMVAADFLNRHFQECGHDPWRNANISISSRGRVPETLPALVFDPLPWKPVPKVLARLGDREGCGHYRIMSPMRALLGDGMVRGGVSLRNLSVPELSELEADVLVFQRQITPELFAGLELCSRYAPAFRCYEIDDLITQIPEGNPHRKEFTPDMLDRFRRGARLCHRLIVATEPLAAAYGDLAAETVVVPNTLSRTTWEKLALPVADGKRLRTGGRPRVGWAGSASHEADLLLLTDVFRELASEVDWVIFGRCPGALRPFVRQVLPPATIEDYPARLAALDLDLAIAPLEINAFNEAKSHLKLLEYGIVGFPVVCTDIVPYQGAFPVTRVRNRAKDWVRAIRTHLGDLVATQAAGRRLREHVQEHWLLEDHLESWRRAWGPQ